MRSLFDIKEAVHFTAVRLGGKCLVDSYGIRVRWKSRVDREGEG
jgi:hypothetical protein